MRHLQDVVKDQRGATAVEYGLILSLIFLAMVFAIKGVTAETGEMWDNVSAEVTKQR